MYVNLYEEAEECTVKMSKELKKLCTPYRGCPRGRIGADGCGDTGEKWTIEKEIKGTLLKYGKYVLKGADEDFVCIAQDDYERMLRTLEGKIKYDEALEAAKQNNDGIDCNHATIYYLASDKSSGVKITDPGWDTKLKGVSKEKPYQWTFKVYDGIGVLEGPRILYRLNDETDCGVPGKV